MKLLLTILVSWYGADFHGKQTASGEVFDMYGYTCAAVNDYDIGDVLMLTNPDNCKIVVVTVNDRGAFGKLGRTLDLSKRAFKSIADLDKGLARVKIMKIPYKYVLTEPK